MAPESLAALIARVRLVVLDVDGVLTDGGLTYFDDGRLAVRFDIKDGLGLARAVREGLAVALVSGRDVPQVRRRAEELGIRELRLGVRDKAAALDAILAETGHAPDETCFVGDDLIDLPAMRRVGLPVAVADAVPEVCAAAAFVTSRAGGRGAVREVIDLILARRDGAEGERR